MTEITLGDAVLVVAWHNPDQIKEFKREWRIQKDDPVIFQQDKTKAGCAATKNAGIKEAYNSGAEVICVVDDDCYPENRNFYPYNIRGLLQGHIAALQPQPVRRVISTTIPNSRGTPYYHISMTMPVAASMGFWTTYPDFDAVSALHLGSTAEVKFNQRAIYGEYFPFCGMNFAFTREWIDAAVLIEAPRWDDIWMGWVWEKVAYEKGFCFNLNGPVVRHSRQSNVWQNLREEARYIEQNETLWETIAKTPHGLSAGSIRKLCVSPLLSSGEGSSILQKPTHSDLTPREWRTHEPERIPLDAQY